MFEKKYGDILTSKIAIQWLEKKIRVFQPYFFGFIILGTACLFCFFIFITSDYSKVVGHPNDPLSNTSSKCDRQFMYFELNPVSASAILCFLFMYCLINIIIMTTGVRIPELKFVYKYMYMHNLNSKKTLVVPIYFYFAMYIFTILCMTVLLVLSIIGLSKFRSVSNLLISVLCVTLPWLMMYLFQVSSFLGHFTIAMQKMVWVLFQFSFLFLNVFIPFVHVFYRLLRTSDGCGHKTFSSTIGEHYYNSFIIVFNLIDITKYKNDITYSEDYYFLLFLHVCYVSLLIILLVNFLIALLSTSVAEVMQHKETILLLQRIRMSAIMEIQMSRFRPFFLLLDYQQRKLFHVEEGKYFLVVVSLNA